MIRKILATILVLVALVGLSFCALGQETQNESIEASNQAENISEAALEMGLTGMSLIEFEQPLPARITVPIMLQNNSTKAVWTSPGDRPAFVFAGLTNTGNLNLDVYTISIDPNTKKRIPPQFAGTAFPAGPERDGVIVFGKFIAIEVACGNSTTFQKGTGILETANWLP